VMGRYLGGVVDFPIARGSSKNFACQCGQLPLLCSLKSVSAALIHSPKFQPRLQH
jgi:hypothetical protein